MSNGSWIALEGTPRLMAMRLYGAGPRLMECCPLRVKDLDFPKNQIVVRSGKGDKDPHTMPPAAVQEPLFRHLRQVRRQHEPDLKKGSGVPCRTLWSESSPMRARSGAGSGCFRQRAITPNRVTGERRQHHLHESVFQRTIKREARLKVGMTKLAGSHTLRHSLATHLLEDG